MENFDVKYMKMAKIWSTNSYALRKKVGAIVVKDNRIVSDGFNGTPAGFENECEYYGRCDHKCTNLFDNNCETCNERQLITKNYVLHAEANAILKAAKYGGIGLEGATLYTTLSPCIECAKLIIQSGISKVIYNEKYRDTSGLDLLKRAKIKVRQIKI